MITMETTISKAIFAFYFILFSFSLHSQTVNLKGTGNGYQLAELRFFVQTDPITRSLKPLFRITCDKNGAFSCLVPCKGTSVISIKTGIYNFVLQVREGENLTLGLPDFAAKPEGEDQNPFFAETKIIPDVINDKENINNLIRVFDSQYNPIFNQVAERVSKNFKRKEIPSIIETLNQVSASMSPEFNSSFIKYRIIMLNMVAYGTYPGRMEDSVFINQKFVPDNQAYLDLIEQIFTGYFRNILTGPLKDSFVNSVSNSSLKELKGILLRDGKAVNDELQDYVILLNLTNEYFNNSIPAENVIKLMTALKTDGSTEFIKMLADGLSDRLSATLIGRTSPDFYLKSNDGRQLSLKDFRGKFVIISFSRSNSPATIMEFGIMKMWQDKYSKDLQIVNIVTDSDFTSAYSRLKERGFNWVFLDGSNADLLEYQYNIKMYPSFILLDRDGRIISDPAPYPSENLEAVIISRIQNR
jgi:hypothetical protein